MFMKDLFEPVELRRLFGRLDERLMNPLSIYVIGGANLIAFGISQRHTQDVDVISPQKLSTDVIEHIENIAREESLESDWINTMPSRDEPFLALGWKERSVSFFSGSKLQVYLLGRKDMVGLKLAAALDRQNPDMDDLLVMRPTDEEWEFGRLWARNYDANADWPELIDTLVLNLKEKKNG